ncbi:MAG: hypothetical protein AAB091_00190, partial [Elusimicrobiota bacterium]
TGRVMFEADLLLKKTMWEGPNTALEFIRWAEQSGAAKERAAVSAIWFVADPESAGATLRQDGNLNVLDIADIKVRTFCDSHENLRKALERVNKEALALSCPKDSRAGFHGQYLQAHYDELAVHYPVLLQLRELYKALLVAKLLYVNGIGSQSLGYQPSAERLTPETTTVKPAFAAGQIMTTFSAVSGSGGVHLTPSYPIGTLPGQSLYGFEQGVANSPSGVYNVNTPKLPGRQFRAVRFWTK